MKSIEKMLVDEIYFLYQIQYRNEFLTAINRFGFKLKESSSEQPAKKIYSMFVDKCLAEKDLELLKTIFVDLSSKNKKSWLLKKIEYKFSKRVFKSFGFLLESIVNEKEIRWLHLSDWHLGQDNLKWKWNNGVKQIVFKDLELLNDLMDGPVDVIFFTGDLVYKGSPEDYENRLKKELMELYTKLDALGSRPFFIPVPGNHDLQWPGEEYNPVIQMLKFLHLKDNNCLNSMEIDSPGLAELKGMLSCLNDNFNYFWRGQESEYYSCINRAFKNYEKWFNSFPYPTIRESSRFEYNKGLFPGDFSAKVPLNGLNLYLTGLNTAFMQLHKGNYHKKLLIHENQFKAVCDNAEKHFSAINADPAHNLSLLLTHHPTEWFSLKAEKEFNDAIVRINSNEKRFALHLFGHMHAPEYKIEWGQNGQNMKKLQGISLFGMETTDAGDRIHGYTAGIFKQIDSKLKMQLLPRKATEDFSKIVPDSNACPLDDRKPYQTDWIEL